MWTYSKVHISRSPIIKYWNIFYQMGTIKSIRKCVQKLPEVAIQTGYEIFTM